MTDHIRQEDAVADNLVIDAPKKPLEDKKLAKYANYHGAYEVAAAQRGKALFTPLEISPRTARMIPNYQSFKEQYELYKVPAHHSTVALGRVNDLHQAGAPRTPAEIPSSTMKHFHKVDNVGTKTDDKLKAQAANQWIEEQDQLHTSFDSYMAARESLNGAMSEWRAMQARLRQRSLEAKKADKSEQKHKIDEAAETLVKITEVSAEALTITIGLEAELMEGVGETYTATAEEGIQTAEVSRKYKTDKLQEVAKKAGGTIGVKELFIIAMGDYKKYTQLQTEIDNLNKQIVDAQLTEEQEHIRSSRQKLENVKIEIKGRQRAFEANRGNSRNAAQAFGQAMNGREKTIMVTLMAEAYQELDLFGTRALQEAEQLQPKQRPVYNWLNDEVDKYKVERQDDFNEFAHDYRTVGGAVVDGKKSYDLLFSEQASWNQAATAWRHFMSDVMDKQFDPQSADVDAQHKVKEKI